MKQNANELTIKEDRSGSSGLATRYSCTTKQARVDELRLQDSVYFLAMQGLCILLIIGLVSVDVYR
jgi:hypothetical protein